MHHFAANLSTLFTERPFEERFKAAGDAGFSAVECQFPYAWPADQLRSLLDEAGLSQVLFNLPPGDWEAGERGLACLPTRRREFHRSVELAIDYAVALGCRRLHAMAGIRPADVDATLLRRCYVDNIRYAATRCSSLGIDVMIEPINSADMPGYYLDDFGFALEIIDEIAASGFSRPKLQFDIYHCARIHGDVCDWIRRCARHIGHFQIAGTPGRNEPDLGDLPLTEILDTIAELGLEHWIGCEYRPAGDTGEGLRWLAPHRSTRPSPETRLPDLGNIW